MLRTVSDMRKAVLGARWAALVAVAFWVITGVIGGREIAVPVLVFTVVAVAIIATVDLATRRRRAGEDG